VIRRAVPLALGLISASNPQLNILDTLSKFSHDQDPEVAHNAIFAMGLLGAGTNNARLAAMLRQLAQYHAKDTNNLFMVRLAQGLVHMGKGTLTLNPYHSDNQLMSPVAVAGLLGCIIREEENDAKFEHELKLIIPQALTPLFSPGTRIFSSLKL
jgi:26S proteasome regulatory subunit N1